MDTAVYFNDYVPTAEAEFPMSEAIDELSEASGSSACGEINSIMQTDTRDGQTYSYREFQEPCIPDQWGYSLSDGRWPDAPGEVVVSPATGLTDGAILQGLAPGDLTVVGQVVNPHATRALTLLAASGTWRSWDWPAASSAFPRLSATVIGYTTSDDYQALANSYHARADSDPSASSLEVANFAVRGAPVVEKMPYLYGWVAVPVAILAAALGLALRARYSGERRRLLIEQGLAPRSAARVVHGAEVIALVPASIGGVLTGWLVGYAAGPVAAWIAGHEPSPMPLPWDPLVRVVGGTIIVWLSVLIASQIGQHGDRSADGVRASGEGARSFATVRHLLAVAGAGMGVFLALSIRDVSIIFAILLLWVVALGLVSPELVTWIVKRFPTRNPASRLAWRRVAERPTAAAVAVMAAALTVGPVIAMATLLASDIAAQNENARTPPREGQALYYLAGDEGTDSRITTMVTEIAGDDASVVAVSTPQTANGDGIVASSGGLGAVDVISSVDDLEVLLGGPVSDGARRVLKDGGILWNPEYGEPQVWTIGAASTTAIPLTGAVSEAFEERWARSTAGFMLEATAESRDLTVVDSLLVFGGLTSEEARQVGDELVRQGFDGSLVRTFRPDDPYSVTPFQLGLIGVLGVVGVAMITSSTRGSVDSLRKQNAGLIALGIPRSWLGRVFLRETGVTLLLGVVAGVAISIVTTLLGLLQLGIGIAVPVVPTVIYLIALSLTLLTIGAMGFARIRS
ncbi:MAG: hypothetical protein ACSLE3_07565 [Microbacteriaceae bacterium]